MSATGRTREATEDDYTMGGFVPGSRIKTERKKNDFYATPAWCTDLILPHLDLSGQILEPAAGDGAIVDRLVRAGVPYTRIDCVELDRERDVPGVCATYADFLSDVWQCRYEPARWDLIITNPPFTLAQAFVEQALKHGTQVAMLLRLGFMEGQKRAPFHRAHPSDVYVLPKRPSFTGDGATDAAAYGWFVWGPGRGGRWSVL